MKRIAFLGSDSTHTEAFGKRINLPGGPFHGQVEVVSIWGDNAAQTAEKAQALKIRKVASRAADALQDVDLAMVIGRFGDSHFEPAMTALERGIPTFVDKPFTLSFQQAEQLVKESVRRKVPLMSASPLRFAKELAALKDKAKGEPFRALVVSAPANCIDIPGGDPRFESTFFYGIHGIELLLEAAGGPGRSYKSIVGRSAVSVHVDFGTFTGVLNLVKGTNEFYAIEGYPGVDRYDYSVELDGSYYERELDFILNRFLTGKGTIPVESTLQAIAILEDAQNLLKELR